MSPHPVPWSAHPPALLEFLARNPVRRWRRGLRAILGGLRARIRIGSADRTATFQPGFVYHALSLLQRALDGPGRRAPGGSTSRTPPAPIRGNLTGSLYLQGHAIWGPFRLATDGARLTELAVEIERAVLPHFPRRLGPTVARLALRREMGSLYALYYQHKTGAFPSERHLDSPAVREICFDPAVRARVAETLGRSPILWRTELWLNRPNEQVAPMWHHDRYPRLIGGRNLSVYIALTDVDEDNGFEYLPPEALAGAEPPRVFDAFSGNAFFQPTPDMERMAHKVALRAGEFVLFTEDLTHRSILNTGVRTRLALSLRVVEPGVRITRGYSPTHCPMPL